MELLRQSLSKLQSTQASISANRKLVLCSNVEPADIMHLLAEEVKSHVPYQRRLALFYLFNDVVQFAAKDHLVDFLEQGCAIFIPAMSKVIEKLSETERVPFLRTLSVWDDRRVFSVHFVDRLRTIWVAQAAPSSAVSAVSSSPLSRFHSQTRCSHALAMQLLSLVPATVNGLVAANGQLVPIADTDCVRALAVSLSAELNDVCSLLVARHTMSSRSVAANVKRHPSFFRYPSNKVQNAYPSMVVFLPLSIARQYMKPLSFYFLVISALSFVKEVSPSSSPFSQLIPVLIVLSISVFRECLQEKNRQAEDTRLNSQLTRVNIKGEWTNTRWADVCVGDVILVPSDQPCPADIVLIASSSPGNSTYIQTTNLDGESNFKPRFGLDKAVVTLDLMTKKESQDMSSAEIIVHANPPRSDLDYFEAEAVFHINTIEQDLSIPPDLVPIDSPSFLSSRSKSVPVEVVRLSVKNFIPREAVIRGSEWIVGLVVYTGRDTKVLLGAQKPGYKVSKIDRITNGLVLLIIAVQCLFGFVSALSTAAYIHKPRWWLFTIDPNQWSEAVKCFFSAILLITSIIPISLVISLEIAKVYQAKFMTADVQMPGMTAPSQALNDDLGQIGYIFSDKTGTLTANELVLKKATVNGVMYETLTELGRSTDPKVSLFITALSVCHDIAPNWTGDLGRSAATRERSIGGMKSETDKERLELISAATSRVVSQAVSRGSSQDEEPRIEKPVFDVSYCGESPDEICLVSACAASLGCVLTQRTQTSLSFANADGSLSSWEIIAFHPFDNARRMSSIVVAQNDSVLVFVKGSDDAVLAKCVFELPEERVAIQAAIDAYAKQSLRTLVFGYKQIAREFIGSRETVESGLALLGCVGTEDRLQEGVPGSICRLRLAGIAIWMITGDKQDTAVEIAKSANLITANMRVIMMDGGQEGGKENVSRFVEDLAESDENSCVVITGRTTGLLVNNNVLVEGLMRCGSVVVCRATKDQKALVVGLVQSKLQQSILTLAIGDGANDVPMIKQADVGVAVLGREGRQAAQNSEYVISQFSHLERLLLVHGRLNYVRTSKMVLYFLFKNLVLALPFSLHATGTTLYSSSAFVSESVSLSFNTFLTALPVFAIGLLERDVSPDDKLIGVHGIAASALVREYPKLYMTGRQNRMFTKSLLSSVFIAALVTGAWIYLTAFAGISDLYPSNMRGKMLDHWAVSQVYFIAVFVVDTAAVLIISESLTVPLILSVIYSSLMCASFLVSDNFDPTNPANFRLWEMATQTLILVPCLLLACVPPIMIGVGMKSWAWRFRPTSRMIWQQAKQLADQRRQVIRTLVKANPEKQEHMMKQHVSVLQHNMSYLYRPQDLEKYTREPLIKATSFREKKLN